MSASEEQAYRATNSAEADKDLEYGESGTPLTLELREQELVAHKELRDLGDIEIRTEVEDVAGRLEVDAYREEVVVEHEAVGETVSERDDPWEEDGMLIIPIYEEQLVVTKRLVLRERMRVRRVGTTERQLFQDTLRRERLVISDPQNTGLVHERYAVADDACADDAGQVSSSDAGTLPDEARPAKDDGGFLGHLVRKALE